MLKRKIQIMLLLLLCNSSLLLAQRCRIGDFITNSDGSQGVVFYVNHEGTGGWMVALNDSPSCKWDNSSNPGDIPNLPNPTDTTWMNYVDGYSDTKIIRRAGDASQFPAAWAMADLGEDWYLPSIGQLRMLCGRLALIEDVLQAHGGSTLTATQYWSSTKYITPAQPTLYLNVCGIDCNVPNSNNASLQQGASFSPLNKKTVHAVRAVRTFSIFEWNTVPPSPQPISYADTLRVFPSENTTYTLLLTMGRCGTMETSVDVMVSPVPEEVTITPAGPMQICYGDEIQLQARTGNNADWAYAWYDLSTEQTFEETGSQLTVDNLTIGSHQIQVVVSAATNGNCSDSTMVEVEVLPPIEALLSGPETAVCVNTVFELLANPSVDSLTYTWKRNGQVVPDWSGPAAHPEESTPGTYEYTVTISNGICTDESEPFTVVIEELIPTVTGPSSVCVDTQFDLVASPTGDGYSYTWKREGVTVPEWTVSTVHPSEAVVGTYHYTVIVTDGICTAESDPVTVTIEDLTADISGPDRVCVGAHFTLQASPAVNSYSYIWKRNGIAISGTGPSLYMTENNVGSHDYTVTISDGICTTESEPLTITVEDLTATLTGSAVACVDVEFDLVAGPAEGYTYTWKRNGVTTSWTEPTVHVTENATGTYEYTVTITNGICDDNASWTVNVTSVTASIEGPNMVCPGNTVTLTAKPDGMSYSWSTGANTQTITVPVGAYSVTVTSGDGCVDEASHTVGEYPSFTASIEGPNMVCPGNTVTLTAKPDGMSYLWNTGATSQSITMPAGDYSVTVTSNDGCVDEASHTVGEYPSFTASIEAPSMVCPGNTVTLTAKPDGMSYLWNTGATSQSITMPAGDYSVTVTSNDGCVDEASHTVGEYPSFTASIEGPNMVCPGNTVTLTAKPDGMSYLWSTGATSQTISVTPEDPSTTYTVEVTSADGCVDEASHTITLSDAIDAWIDGPNATCPGTQVTLTAKPDGMASYVWSTGETTQSISAPIGDYTVAMTSADGCEGNASHTVTAFPSVTASIEGDTEVCEGSPFTLTASPEGMSYAWSTGETTRSITVTPSAPSQTYDVTVTSADGCSDNTAHEVTVKPLPIANAGEDVNVPYNSSATLVAADAGAGAEYHWEPTDMIDGDPNQQTVTTVPLTEPTIFYLTVTLNGCQSAESDAVTVTVGDALYAYITADPTSVCPGETTTLTAHASNGTGNYTYSWTPADLIATGQGTDVVTTTPLNDPTEFTCLVSDGNETATPQVTVTPFPSVTASIEGDTEVCEGSPVTLTAYPDGMSYAWSTGETTRSITVTPVAPSQTYDVTVTSADGCSDNATHAVTVKPVPIADAGEDVNVPYNTSATLTAADAGAGAEYHWEPTDMIDGDPNQQTVTTVSLTEPTIFYLTVTLNGCQSADSDAVTVTVGNALYAYITADPTSVCPGETTTLTVHASNGTGNYTYNWTPEDLIASGQGTDVVTTTALTAQTEFTCSVSDGNETVGPKVTVMVSSSFTASIEGDTEVCEGSPVTLTAYPEGMSYAWSTGETTRSITVTPSAPSQTYEVTVTSADGCFDNADHSVTVNLIPIADAGEDFNVPYDTPATLTAANAGDGAIYHWSPENLIAAGQGEMTATTVSLTNPVNTFQLTVTLNGCESAESDEVTAYVGDALYATASADPESVCPGGVVTLTVSAMGGTEPYSYEWQPQNAIDGDAAAQTVTTTALNTDQPFTCTVTDVEGVTYTAHVTVTMKPLPLADASGSDHFVALGTSATLVAADAGDGAQYFWEPEDQIESGQGTMTATTIPLGGPGPQPFYLTVTSPDGCINADLVNVEIGGALDVTVTAEPVCQEEPALLTALPVGGTGQYSYQWEPQELIVNGQGTALATTVPLNEDQPFEVTVSDGYDAIKVPVMVTVETPYFDTIFRSACHYYEWYGESYSDPGYHEHIVEGPVCDSTFVLYLEIVDGYNDTIPVTACDFYEWNGNPYYSSDFYTQQFVSQQGCDSIVTLNLNIIDPDIQILGYQDIYYASDIWHGIYHYYVVDSIAIPLAPIQWQCSNPDWILLPVSDYHCRLIATTEGPSVLTAHTLIAENCDEEMSIVINAKPYYDDDETPTALFPNPARTQVTVQAEGLTQVKLFNLLGQLMSEIHVNTTNSVDIDTGKLERGVYMVEITTVNEVIVKYLILATY